MKVKVLPYKPGSKSAKELVRVLGSSAILKSQRTPVYGRRKTVINWGHSAPRFSLTGVTVLNKPEAVAQASNKLAALQVMKEAGVNVPEFTSDRDTAEGWTEEESIVLCRTLLRANSGRGITIAKTAAELVAAPLYVKYIRKEVEYRLHVFNGQIIDAVEKRRRSGFQEANNYNRYIRSYEQGWVFARENVVITEAVKEQAIKAVTALGLDFGAVDIVMSKGRNSLPYVLEVNCAPGLQGTTLTNYKRAVIQWMQSL